MGLFVLPKKRNAGEMEYKHKLQRAWEKLRLVREEPRVPGKSDGSPRRNYGSSGRNRSVRPEWRRMSGGFSRIPQRLADFNAFRRPNRVDNARFSAIHFKTSDLPPLVACIQTDARPR